MPGQDVSDTWVIVVHGNSLSAADGLRMVPILTGAGYPTLVATYRNDPGAPADPSGKLRYGLTEWEDLEAMVRYALDEGSDGVVLDGYSMGGAVIMAFLQRSELADQVRAVILDAPMLDFSETVDDNASREEIAPGVPLPSSLTDVAKWIAAKRFDVDWDGAELPGRYRCVRATCRSWCSTGRRTPPCRSPPAASSRRCSRIRCS